MKLIPADGSPEMTQATNNQSVKKIVTILLHLQEENLSHFKHVMLFIRDCKGETNGDFKIKKYGLQLFFARNYDANGVLITPNYVQELLQALDELYNQSKKIVGYRRGAVVELLAYNLVSSRYKNEECQNNYKFSHPSQAYKNDQIDVAVLSQRNQSIEAYTCKMNSISIESSDCTNLTKLEEVAQELEYQTHIGAVCFNNSNVIHQRLMDLTSADIIAAYGLDNMHYLKKSPFS